MKSGKGRIIIHPNTLHFQLFGRIKRNNIHNARERMGKDSVFACLAVCYCERFVLHRLKNRGGGGAYFMLQPLPEVQIWNFNPRKVVSHKLKAIYTKIKNKNKHNSFIRYRLSRKMLDQYFKLDCDCRMLFCHHFIFRCHSIIRGYET
jgi:hypothetical protein